MRRPHLLDREGIGAALLAVAVVQHKALEATHLDLPMAEVLLAADQRCGWHPAEVVMIQQVRSHLQSRR